MLSKLERIMNIKRWFNEMFAVPSYTDFEIIRLKLEQEEADRQSIEHELRLREVLQEELMRYFANKAKD
jgi:hypothetical protein